MLTNIDWSTMRLITKKDKNLNILRPASKSELHSRIEFLSPALQSCVDGKEFRNAESCQLRENCGSSWEHSALPAPTTLALIRMVITLYCTKVNIRMNCFLLQLLLVFQISHQKKNLVLNITNAHRSPGKKKSFKQKQKSLYLYFQPKKHKVRSQYSVASSGQRQSSPAFKTKCHADIHIHTF